MPTDRETREELRANSAFLRRLIHDVDAIVLANSIRALLDERDVRSPHYLLGYALREAFDRHVRSRVARKELDTMICELVKENV